MIKLFSLIILSTLLNTPNLERRQPLLISAGLVAGHSDHLYTVHKAFVDSGWILPDDKIDFVIHTWDIKFNNQYVQSLDRYKDKYNVKISVEKYSNEFLPRIYKMFGSTADINWKPFLLFYSFWKACQLIERTVHIYDLIIRYKVDIKSNAIPFGIQQNLRQHFKTNSILSYPNLYNFSYTDCMYARSSPEYFIERCFTTFPNVIKKAFLKKSLDELMQEVLDIQIQLYSKNIRPYTGDQMLQVEGSTLWYEFMKRNNIPVIDCPNPYSGHDRGNITPPFTIGNSSNGLIVNNSEEYEYIYTKETVV